MQQYADIYLLHGTMILKSPPFSKEGQTSTHTHCTLILFMKRAILKTKLLNVETLLQSSA